MKTLEAIEKLEKIKIKGKSTSVIICKVPFLKNSYDGMLLGRKLYDWVAFACNGRSIKFVDFTKGDNILSYVKKHIDKSFDYTLLLMSSTPLLESSDIDNIIEYATIKDVNLCNLPSGFIFKNDYLLNTDNYFVDSVYSFNLDNFYIVENKKQFNYALDVLQKRINDFHMENGVEIIKPSSTYIEPEVDISDGVVIYPNNTLKGKTKIMNDVILKENNVIDNSKIGKGCCISRSNVINSVLGKNVYISAFCDVLNALIGEESIIESHSSIVNYNVEAKSKIASHSRLGERNDSNSGTR